MACQHRYQRLERRAVSARRRPVRHRGPRRPPDGCRTARRWSYADYLTRTTCAPAVPPASVTRNRGLQAGLDRGGTPAAVRDSTRRLPAGFLAGMALARLPRLRRAGLAGAVGAVLLLVASQASYAVARS